MADYEEYDSRFKKGDLLNKNRYEIIEKIGEGGFGLVYWIFIECLLKLNF